MVYLENKTGATEYIMGRSYPLFFGVSSTVNSALQFQQLMCWSCNCPQAQAILSNVDICQLKLAYPSQFILKKFCTIGGISFILGTKCSLKWFTYLTIDKHINKSLKTFFTLLFSAKSQLLNGCFTSFTYLDSDLFCLESTVFWTFLPNWRNLVKIATLQMIEHPLLSTSFNTLQPNLQT